MLIVSCTNSGIFLNIILILTGNLLLRTKQSENSFVWYEIRSSGILPTRKFNATLKTENSKIQSGETSTITRYVSLRIHSLKLNPNGDKFPKSPGKSKFHDSEHSLFINGILFVYAIP